MRMCYVYMNRELSPIVIRGYINHKINIFGFEYLIWTKDIEYFKIERSADGEET